MPRPPSQPLLRAPRPVHPLTPPVPEVPAARFDVEDPPSDPPVSTAEGEQMRTFTTRLPVDLRRRLRRHAINTDQTLEQVARAMVREYLDRHEADHS